MKEVELTTLPVVGTDHCLGNENFELLDAIGVGTELDLYRDPDNFHDRLAIKVVYDDQHIGWVPADKNRILAAMMDGGLDIIARTEPQMKQRQSTYRLWITFYWRRELTEREQAQEVVKHSKRRKKRNVPMQ